MNHDQVGHREHHAEESTDESHLINELGQGAANTHLLEAICQHEGADESSLFSRLKLEQPDELRKATVRHDIVEGEDALATEEPRQAKRIFINGNIVTADLNFRNIKESFLGEVIVDWTIVDRLPGSLRRCVLTILVFNGVLQKLFVARII